MTTGSRSALKKAASAASTRSRRRSRPLTRTPTPRTCTVRSRAPWSSSLTGSTTSCGCSTRPSHGARPRRATCAATARDCAKTAGSTPTVRCGWPWRCCARGARTRARRSCARCCPQRTTRRATRASRMCSQPMLPPGTTPVRPAGHGTPARRAGICASRRRSCWGCTCAAACSTPSRGCRPAGRSAPCAGATAPGCCTRSVCGRTV